MTIEQIKNRISYRKEEMQKKFHIKSIGVFGSYAKNMQTKKSDIDILVEFEKGHKDFFNYMRLKLYLEKLFGRKVDLVIKEAIKPQLKERILNEVVYG